MLKIAKLKHKNSKVSYSFLKTEGYQRNFLPLSVSESSLSLFYIFFFFYIFIHSCDCS